MSGCPLLAPTEYLNRHDRLQCIHWCLRKNFGLPHESNWWEHKTPKVIENKNSTILWDFEIHTIRTIQANRPDTVVKDHGDNSFFLIDISVPSDTNVSHKIFEKLSKCKDGNRGHQNVASQNNNTIVLVIGVLCMVANTAPNYVLQIPGAPSLTELQKVTLMGTAHILRKVLSM